MRGIYWALIFFVALSIMGLLTVDWLFYLWGFNGFLIALGLVFIGTMGMGR